MKTLLFTLALSIALVGTTGGVNAQIPNNGFELWDSSTNYFTPKGYVTPNPNSAGVYYPVRRSTDHFPESVGNYSLRIQSNTAYLPDAEALGLVL
jgi:hypothetical protein